VLVGERGSGERCTAASSISGGCAVVRMRMLRARRAVNSINFSFWARCSRSCFFCWIMARDICRSVIFILSLFNAVFVGSMARPREQESDAKGSLSRARRAREDR